jgi:hypothetical protein
MKINIFYLNRMKINIFYLNRMKINIFYLNRNKNSKLLKYLLLHDMNYLKFINHYKENIS